MDPATQKPAISCLLKPIRFRNEYPAFDGIFSVLESDPSQVSPVWEKDDRPGHDQLSGRRGGKDRIPDIETALAV